MKLNTFYTASIIFRLLLILILSLSSIYTIYFTPFWLLGLFLMGIAIIVFVLLINFLKKNEKELHQFLIGISQGDFSMNYNKKKYVYGKTIPDDFTVISQKFTQIRRDKESEHLLLKTVIDKLETPLLGFYLDNQEIIISNKAFENLSGVIHRRRLDQLKYFNKSILDKILKIESGKSDLIKLTVNEIQQEFVIFCTELVMQERAFKLIVFQNISRELSNREQESWDRLIKVLTHEIRNSAIPITTMSEILEEKIAEGNSKSMEEEDYENLHNGLKTIRRRSANLMAFITNYDKLSNKPKVEMQEFNLIEVLEGILSLFKEQYKNIEFTFSTNKQEVMINSDPSIIEQVIINLVKNGCEATENSKSPRISITLKKDSTVSRITISDNGDGINKDIQEQIFTPFYTTKEKGSGIGLSLSKRLINILGGDINYSTSSKGTSFIIEI